MFLFGKKTSNKQYTVQLFVFKSVYITMITTSLFYTKEKQLRCSTIIFFCKMVYMSGQVFTLKFHLNR